MVGEFPKKKRRSKEAVEEDVQRLRDWLDKQPHLPHDVEYEILLAFVSGTKTLEVAKRKLDAYFSNRNKAAVLYHEIGRDVNEKFREKCRSVNLFYLSNLTPEGYKVLFFSLNDCSAKEFDHAHVTTRILMTLELGMMKWPDSPGQYQVVDCTGTSTTLITRLSPTILAASLKFYQEGYPIKMKGSFNINAHPLSEFILNNFFKPWLKIKLYNRIKIVNEGVSYVKQYMPLELLPSNYGGNDKSSVELNDYWLNLLEENREWFQLSTKQVSDEKKRPPDSENTYGIEGTFRKLAVD